jgi:hypothetical protein
MWPAESRFRRPLQDQVRRLAPALDILVWGCYNRASVSLSEMSLGKPKVLRQVVSGGGRGWQTRGLDIDAAGGSVCDVGVCATVACGVASLWPWGKLPQRA